jgi:hypothetical protein
MSPEPLRIDVGDGAAVSALLHAPAGVASGVGLVLGHGAGNDMRTLLLDAVATGLAARGHAVLRFNFLYKELGKKAPDPMPRLERAFRAAIAALRERRPARLVLGGKSMGGRVASLVAAAGEPCDGLVFLGYPLHPARQPEKMRDQHLVAVRAPMLFLEGTRDPLCDLALLRPVLARLGDRASLHIVEGGDHSFEVPKALHRTPESVHAELVDAIDGWLGRSGLTSSRLEVAECGA